MQSGKFDLWGWAWSAAKTKRQQAAMLLALVPGFVTREVWIELLPDLHPKFGILVGTIVTAGLVIWIGNHYRIQAIKALLDEDVDL